MTIIPNKETRKIELQAFLQDKGSGIDQVIQSARSMIELYPTDLLLAVGSLVEGLGTSKSDLDLILITDRDPKSMPDSEHLGWVAGSCLVDMLVFHRSKASSILESFWHWSEQKWDVSRAIDFDIKKRTILHRFFSGVPLIQPSSAIDLKFPTENGLAALKLHVARQSARTMLVDLVGLQDFEDYRSLVFTANEVLGLTTEALLAGFGLLNPLVKWRSRQLEAVPDNWLIEINSTFAKESAAETVWRLARFPKRVERESALRYVNEIVVFSRSVFFWAEKKLHGLPMLPEFYSLSNRDSASNDHTSVPGLRLDSDILVTVNGMAISRLNEFDSPVVLDDEEVRLLLLFDGKTSRELVLARVFGDARSRLGVRVLDGLVSKLENKGILHHD